MSYAAPARFRVLALPEGALEGVDDVAIQAHLDAASARINRKLRGRNLTVPIAAPAGAIAELGDVECWLAAWTLVTGFRGTPPDDPGIAGLRDLAKQAWNDIEEIAAGLQNTGASPVVAGGGGLIQAIPPADELGVEEPAWWA